MVIIGVAFVFVSTSKYPFGFLSGRFLFPLTKIFAFFANVKSSPTNALLVADKSFPLIEVIVKYFLGSVFAKYIAVSVAAPWNILFLTEKNEH